MLKYIFRCTTGSFSRTIGRILAYIVISALILFLGSFLNISNVNAASDFSFLGYKLDDTFTIPSNGSKTGTIRFNTTGWSKHDGGAFAYVDICTTGYEPTLWITSNVRGAMSPSTKWYKVNMACNAGNYKATVYRQIIYISESSYQMGLGEGTDSSGNPADVGTAVTYNSSTGQLWSNTDYNVTMRVLHFGVTTDIPLADLAYDNDLTQTQVLKDILEVLQKQNNSDVTSAINNQTQKIEEQIQKQEETNKKLDETNDYLKDDTPPNADISSLGNVQGLLPPGPLDSLLNIPFNFLSIVVSSLSGTCVPLESKFVFDTTLTYPCFSDFYDSVPTGIMVFVNIIPSAFILIIYFKHLYKKVDRAMSLESNSDDEWGVL